MRDPRNVQVVIQGENDDVPLYLVSDVGIIRSIEKAPHEPNELVELCDTIESLHNALRE